MWLEGTNVLLRLAKVTVCEIMHCYDVTPSILILIPIELPFLVTLNVPLNSFIVLAHNVRHFNTQAYADVPPR